MTKGQIRASVRNALRKIDSTARYHDKVIDSAIEFSMNQFLYDLYRKDPREVDQYIREYGTDVPLEIKQDRFKGEYYTSLPAPYVVFPDKQSGVRYVVGHDIDQTLLYPMSAQEALMANRTYIGSSLAEDGDPYTRSFYIVRGDKLTYYNTNSHLRSAGVKIGIVIPFSEYADEDEIRMPFGQSDNTFVMVLEKLSKIPPTELKDNNKDE